MGDFDQIVITEPPRQVVEIAEDAQLVLYVVEQVSGAGAGTDGITQEQADARYLRIAQLGQTSGVARLDGGGRLPASELTTHSHLMSEITGLTSALDTKADSLVTDSIEARLDADAPVVHEQGTPAATWTVNHPFGRPPVIELIIGGRYQIPDAELLDTQAVLTFPQPVSGTVILR